MRKIAIVTATRAEYGLLTPLIRRVQEDPELELDLIVTGTHLSEEYGYTIDGIYKDGFLIAHKIPILEKADTSYDISLTMANTLRGFAECFHNDRPDMVVILGDRTEMLAVASAAMNERIPIAHIHGGEVTEGAVDDCIRHALTKMSYLHFVTTNVYRNRVIQLGEAPSRVFNVGSLGTENIVKSNLMGEEEIKKEIGIPLELPYVVVTFHPVTLESFTAEAQVGELCQAMEKRGEFFYLITKANSDVGGKAVNSVFSMFVEKRANVNLIASLGMVRYLSAVKYACFVLGNSSSGILEAPVLGTPTVNIGDRQKGRLTAKTICHCQPDSKSIMDAMTEAMQMPHETTTLYGDGKASIYIVDTIKDFFDHEKINLKKGFYEVKNII